MKQTTTILSTCIAMMLLLISCAAPKQMSSTTSKKSPQFIDNLTLGGGSNNVKLTQKEQIHRNKKIKSMSSETETVESKDFAEEAIRREKRRNESLYNFIEEWYGTPYKYGGNSKSGIDCSAFTKELYSNVYSLPLVRTAVEQFSNAQYVPSSELKEGDLVFFKIHSRHISHVGVYLYDGNFVHASVSQGVVISNLNDAYWTHYYAGAGRVNHG